MGAFVHDHYFIKIITDSGGTYVFALLTAVALGSWFGFYHPVQVPLEGVHALRTEDLDDTVVPKSPWGSTPSLDRSRPRLTTTDTGRVQSQTGKKNTLRPPNRWWPNSARPKPQKIELHLARARISRISVSVWTVNQEERQDVVPIGQSRDFGMRSWTNKICNRFN